MVDSQKSKKHGGFLKKYNRKWLFFGLAVAVLILAALGYMLISKLTNTNTAKNDSHKGKVLTVSDLEKPDVDLSPDTSNASVENLTKALETNIDNQINAKENPIDTVKQFAGVLSNTTNDKRQDQLTNFLEDFLTNHSDTLWLNYKNSKPNQAQVNYWNAELYVYLIYNFKNMMDNQYKGADGKVIDTTKQQLKYIDLYLSLANDPKSHIAKSEQSIAPMSDYDYIEANNFSEFKKDLTARTVK